MQSLVITKLKEPQNKEFFNDKLDLIIEELSLQRDSRERVKDIIKELKEKFDISPTIIRKLAKAKLDNDIDSLLEENTELVGITAAIN